MGIFPLPLALFLCSGSLALMRQFKTCLYHHCANTLSPTHWLREYMDPSHTCRVPLRQDHALPHALMQIPSNQRAECTGSHHLFSANLMQVGFEELLARADIVTVHVPNSPATNGRLTGDRPPPLSLHRSPLFSDLVHPSRLYIYIYTYMQLSTRLHGHALSRLSAQR